MSHHFVSQHHGGNESWVASPEELLHARNLLHRQQHNERQQRAAELTGEDLVLAGADVVVEDDYEIRQLLEERGLPVAPAAAADGSEVDSRSAAALRRRRRMVIIEANGPRIVRRDAERHARARAFRDAGLGHDAAAAEPLPRITRDSRVAAAARRAQTRAEEQQARVEREAPIRAARAAAMAEERSEREAAVRAERAVEREEQRAAVRAARDEREATVRAERAAARHSKPIAQPVVQTTLSPRGSVLLLPKPLLSVPYNGTRVQMDRLPQIMRSCAPPVPPYSKSDSPGAAKMSHSHPPCLLLTAISVLTYFLPSG